MTELAKLIIGTIILYAAIIIHRLRQGDRSHDFELGRELSMTARLKILSHTGNVQVVSIAHIHLLVTVQILVESLHGINYCEIHVFKCRQNGQNTYMTRMGQIPTTAYDGL